MSPGTLLEALAYGVFVIAGIVLTIVDIRHRRLPDRIVLPLALCGLVLFGASAAVTGDMGPWYRAVLAAVVLGAGWAVVAMLRPGMLGGGDVKLSVATGLYAGWVSWDAVALAVAVTAVTSGVCALVCVFAGRIDARATLPLGPWLLVGAAVGIVSGLAR